MNNAWGEGCRRLERGVRWRRVRRAGVPAQRHTVLRAARVSHSVILVLSVPCRQRVTQAYAQNTGCKVGQRLQAEEGVA